MQQSRDVVSNFDRLNSCTGPMPSSAEINISYIAVSICIRIYSPVYITQSNCWGRRARSLRLETLLWNARDSELSRDTHTSRDWCAGERDDQSDAETDERTRRPRRRGTDGRPPVVVDVRLNGQPRLITGVVRTTTSTSSTEQHQRPVLQHRWTVSHTRLLTNTKPSRR